MKKISRIFALSVLVVAAFSANSVMACTASQWDGGSTGGPLDGEPPSETPRVSGKCGMVLTAAGNVKDLSPVDEAQAFIRFYVFASADFSGNPIIFQAFDLNDNSLLTVAFDGTDFTFDGDGVGTAESPGQAGWNMVELAWVGGDKMDFWVNIDATEAPNDPSGSVTAAAGTMESVILGTPADASFTGTLAFDDYVSHRSTPVGGLLIGDGSDDGSVDVADIVVARNEALGRGLASGTPDCTLDGLVDVADIVCTRNKALGR